MNGAGGLPPGLERERQVLIVLAHPDDESFGCGGRMALWNRAGVPVSYICATLGQLGRNMGRPPAATRESLPALRERELRQACDVLGVRDLHLLRLFDKTVEFEDRDAVAARIEAVLRQTEPSLVLTSHPQYGGHPDHNAVGAATLRAIERLPAGSRPRVHVSIHPNQAERLAAAGLELHTVDVSSVADVKRAALAAHASQTRNLLRQLAEQSEERLQRMLTEERWIELPVEG